ncbi:TetR family transcriptional regulator [Leptospira kobayashii]|uniref:TetR family transcriptional regulator n=1 Tax=Leptospira kobayashii TaxID=1917830 RepID=A0ABN6KDX7_9LEPT|nr:TetR/AcrR family transcriptional regulator [Leptospira kobayashii]BDA79228.1 TetR family transcriptional regulator [Leptospira kobayashii]
MAQEKSAKIISLFQREFLRKGVSRITVDEIVARIGITKPTLYKYFESKEELFSKALNKTNTDILTKMDSIMNTKKEYSEKIKDILNVFHEDLHFADEEFLKKLEFQAPEVWEEVQEFRRVKFPALFKKVLNEGISKGYITKDINKELIADFFIYYVRNFISYEPLSKYNMNVSSAYQFFIQIFFKGILTEKGRSYF